MTLQSPSTQDSRVHISLGVADLDASIAFYATLFGREPSKRRPGYAKFEPGEPALNLSLVHTAGRSADVTGPEHFGVELASQDAVVSRLAALEGAGLNVERETRVACCYAVQDKGWLTDPDGRRWEIFVVTDEADELAPRLLDAPVQEPASAPCCAPTCCDGMNP